MHYPFNYDIDIYENVEELTEEMNYLASFNTASKVDKKDTGENVLA